ncbi:MAG TPA: M3 family oligoendopeptidase [Firmicutes bacterium]|nr:M3 family oligoendopeptidase [Candidatus Fermentithermobacillaceae bacterium]
MFKNLNQTWDLDVFFSGGSKSPEFAKYLDELEVDVTSLAEKVKNKPVREEKNFEELIDEVQRLSSRLRHASSFVSCLNAQDVTDTYARILAGRVQQIQASFSTALTHLDSEILKIPDDEWKAILSSETLRPLAFNLNERRQRAMEMLPPEQEALVSQLSVDGYHGWSNLYDLTTGKMTITVEEEGKPVTMSPGQLSNRMSDPDAHKREYLMEKWEEAWANVAEFCALALNHLAGYRLNLYRARGWDLVLKEPLEINRMTEETLNAMWDTIDKNKERLVTYLKRKKEYLGLDKLGWQDISAPLGRAKSKMSYEAAAEFIVEQFGKFSPKMAQFATHAFTNRWIEAEDRPGKRMGGFCTTFPEKKQSRIFVTFSGTLGNVATVAHELGHGFHQSVMNDLPPMTQQYAMNVAETASTFAEMIVADAAVKHAKDREERLLLIDDKLQRAVALLMNIQSRFLFETRFYEERKKGMVSVKRLNEIMLQAQKDAFCGALDVYHPHFWASKLHFYNTRVPFYNFPYTFGFLFSAGVYAKAMEAGTGFEDRYADLLRDTGRMRVEDLAKKHLGVDLTKPGFWQSAIDLVLSDLDEFLKMTAK